MHVCVKVQQIKQLNLSSIFYYDAKIQFSDKLFIMLKNQIGRIDLEEMSFYAYHGCFEEEQRVGNRFMVNISIETDCSRPSHSDNIEDALNYVSVYEITREQMAINSHLLEHVTNRIIDAIYTQFPYVLKVTVKVSKMTPPMGGQMRCVSVTLSR